MTEVQIDKAYAARDQFMEEVRAAYRKVQETLSEEELEYIIDNMQDSLSLYSPWMNG